MLANYQSVSFIATQDMEISRSFYEKTLGLKFVADEPYSVVFDMSGHTLRISKVSEFAAANYTVFGWCVDNISSTLKALAQQGVVFETHEGMVQDDLGIWVSPSGAKVAWFKDPDGNVLSLTQLGCS